MAEITSTVVTSNVSSSSEYLPRASLDSISLVSAVVLSVCFLLGVPGNIAVIILKPNWQHLSSLSQHLMLNLAMSDLICLLTLPLWIYSLFSSWTLGLVACKLLMFLVYSSIYSSQLTVSVLSVHRYLLVVHRQRCSNEVRIRMLLVLLWLVAMMVSIPSLVVQQLVTDEQWTCCQGQFISEAQKLAVLLTEVMVVFVSLSIVAFAYFRLHKKVNQAAFFNNPQTTRLVTSITVTLFVLWLPYLCINLLIVAATYLNNEGMLKFCADTRTIFGALTFMNSCLNPLLYAFTSHNICAVCQKLRPLRQTVQMTPKQDVPPAAEP
ncbi:C-C chemokine receptor type 8-like [Leuresthes tenuis]|uniref:C-C chemokine receptor type 8-like n=1 Tax=Leuresthes tenuis TaxID=355514 RepID=UPI003B5093BF